jgi:predicted nuclease of predicted toxin-antitoxin system
MKFLLNMNMPRELGRRLAAKGHDWRHVRDIAMAHASDVTILEEARES